MISDQDHRFISRFDSAPDAKGRDAVISSEAPLQLAETFYTLLNQVSKDTTVQYLLTLLDDVLQEDKTRVEIFKVQAFFFVHHFSEYQQQILNYNHPKP